jgi:hypothetical protein
VRWADEEFRWAEDAAGTFVACDLTLCPSPKGEGGPDGGRNEVVLLLL